MLMIDGDIDGDGDGDGVDGEYVEMVTKNVALMMCSS